MYNKPSITFYFFRLGNSSGGAERMVIRLANQMDERGYDVHMVSWDEEGDKSSFSMNKGVCWHKLGFNKGVVDKIRRSFALYRVLCKTKSKCFIGFVMSADKSIYTANLLARVPMIACERNSPEMYFIKFRALVRNSIFSLLRMVKVITVQFEQYKEKYPAYLQNKIIAIPNSVMDVNDYARVDVSDNGRYILLCASRLNFQKQIPLLIEAFDKIKAKFPDWDLKIVGEGDAREEIEGKIKELGLEGRVFAGGASNNMGKEYSAAHLFCLPSKWEGFPNSLSEAMAHGLPCVGFENCDGVKYLIKDEHNGLLTDNLEKSLEDLMLSSTKRVSMGKNAIEDMKKFDAIKIFDQWEKIIKGEIK